MLLVGRLSEMQNRQCSSCTFCNGIRADDCDDGSFKGGGEERTYGHKLSMMVFLKENRIRLGG
eukprot:scaffold5407_cov132-Cylindrotheca_fusiformis.AAC.2